LLIDEIENGLEPHRIRHLLNYLQNLLRKEPNPCGQAIMTSHSPTVVVELNVETLYVVRSNNGETTIKNVAKELQGTIRKVPESLLGQKVVVCEGKTEYGLCRSIQNYWVNQCSHQPLAYQGVVLVEGGGDDSPKRALELAQLGYATCLFVDGDKLKTLTPDIPTLQANCVSVFHWSDGFSTEQRVAMDLSWQSLLNAIILAKSNFGEESVLASTCYQLGKDIEKIGKEVEKWVENGISEGEIRIAFGKAAKEKGWFKRIDRGEDLGGIIVSDMANLKDKEIAMKLSEIEGWIYG
jgi:putative ATP-dependent endonuclease of OLD family